MQKYMLVADQTYEEYALYPIGSESLARRALQTYEERGQSLEYFAFSAETLRKAMAAGAFPHHHVQTVLS